jgi:ABC-type glycerol-3-phosphate transport system substrate-binding protein
MQTPHLTRRTILLGTAAAALSTRPGRAAAPVQLVSHRYPALEFWASKMKTAVPGTEVNTQLMPFDKALELSTIALSSKSDTLDLIYVSEATVQTFARNKWLRPLDDLWARYRQEFKLDDYADEVMKLFSRDGHIYVIPAGINVMMLFYRKDLFDAAGKQLPITIAEYQSLAKSFNTPRRAGTISCLKPVDACMNEAHWYMNTIGPGWFDANWKPIFNADRGVQAIEALKDTTRAAQRGFSTAANDECMIALQQDLAAMGLQWATRANAMDDPKQSHVIGKIGWAAPPEGHARVSADGYAISAFSKQDADTLFRIVATATSEANMREASALTLVPRRTLLNDVDLKTKNRFYPAATASLSSGTPFPQIPEFYAVGEFIARRIVQSVTGEMPTKPALDAAAVETENFLKSRGYYN